jgi:hypothetical protein
MTCHAKFDRSWGRLLAGYVIEDNLSNNFYPKIMGGQEDVKGKV